MNVHTYKDTIAWNNEAPKQALVRACSIQNIALSSQQVLVKLKTLVQIHYDIAPKQSRYTCLEVNEFWTFVGSKYNKK